MEKKKNIGNVNPLRSFFSFGDAFGAIFGRKYFSKNNAGFTLIELLIVIAVLGILAGAVVIFLNPAGQIQKAQDAKRKGDLSQIQKAIETYYNDIGQYPATSANDATLPYRIKSNTTTILDWGVSTGWPYMDTLPKDPSSAKNYAYCSPSSSGGQSYYLYASLGGDGNSPSNFVSADCPDTSCGADTTCNYGISSPNVSP